MNEVIALHSSACLYWISIEGEEIPVHSVQQLAAHVSDWRDYGQEAKIRNEPADGRGAVVTALGNDGWLAEVRDGRATSGGWPTSQFLTRLQDDGGIPKLTSDSPLYIANEYSDLAGSTFFAEQIQVSPSDVAQAIWSWLTETPIPKGFVLGKARRNFLVVDTFADALWWISYSGEQPWPTDAAQAAIELAEELEIDRVVVSSPMQVAVRLRGTARRVRFQFRSRAEAAFVRVTGLTDDLGHEFTMKLPGREIERVKPNRGSN